MLINFILNGIEVFLKKFVKSKFLFDVENGVCIMIVSDGFNGWKVVVDNMGDGLFVVIVD